MKTIFASLVLALTSIGEAAGLPNVVVILVDDMGFSDLGCYGSEIPTPHLDALAKNGLRFSQFYNTGRCCPTRAALLTGQYAHQVGVGHMTEDQGVPGYAGRLNEPCRTLAERLKPAGYFTAFSGKWHVGQNHGVTPWGRGFDRSLNAAAGGFYYPGSPKAILYLNGESVANDDPRLTKDWYSTDLWTDQGLQFIDEARAAEKPFYLHLCYNAPHFPLQAPAESIEKFRGSYREGWEVIQQTRWARQIEMGLVDASWVPAPRPADVAAWASLNDEERDRFDHLMAVYAACVYQMDLGVGRLVDGLRSRGVLDDTLLLFMSDNGGTAEGGPSGKSEGDPTEATSNWFAGEGWAFAQNTPFRLYKRTNHEGGIATPLIAHWPNGIAAKDEVRTHPTHVIDIAATVCEAAGVGAEGLEGLSLLPAFRNEALVREALFWEHEGNAAVRAGDEKLVRRGLGGAWELYDLKTDRTESHDLATERPERVVELAAMWKAWAERSQVLPRPEAGKKKKGAGKKGKGLE